MDFVTGLPKTLRGFDSIFVVIDKLSKRALFITCFTDISSVDTASLYIKEVYRHYGLPKTIISDRDSKFTSGFWQALHQQLGTKLAMSSANHPQTDGQTERLNRTLEDMLRCTVSFQQDDWDLQFPLVEFAYNNAVNAATGFTPFYVDTGRHPRTPQDNVLDLPQCPVPPTVQDFVDHLDSISEITRDALQTAQERQASYYNRRRRNITYDVGDEVLIELPYLVTPAERRRDTPKLRFRHDGPYVITEVINPNAYRVQLPPRVRAHDVFNIAALTPFKLNDIPDRQLPILPSVVTDQGEEYTVSDILAHSYMFDQAWYLTVYEGETRFDATWQPRDSFIDNDAQGYEVVLDKLLQHERSHGIDPLKPRSYRTARR
jgi:hypothetical protein